MIDKRCIFEIYRLKDTGLSNREIAGQLQMDRETVAKYLKNPNAALTRRKKKTSKLDPYRDLVSDMVKQYPAIKAPVVILCLIISPE